jgi:hypothetical protein
LTLSSGGTFSTLTATMLGTGTITSNTNATLGALTINSTTGTTTLGGTFTLSATSTTTLTSGTLNLNGYTLSCCIFSFRTQVPFIAFGGTGITSGSLSYGGVSGQTLTEPDYQLALI